MEDICGKVYGFWCTYGRRLESENGVGSFKYELVQKMGDLHVDVVGVRDKGSVGSGELLRKIQEVVSLQRRHMMQFEFCLDEFNRYLTGLGLLVVLCDRCDV